MDGLDPRQVEVGGPVGDVRVDGHPLQPVHPGLVDGIAADGPETELVGRAGGLLVVGIGGHGRGDLEPVGARRGHVRERPPAVVVGRRRAVGQREEGAARVRGGRLAVGGAPVGLPLVLEQRARRGDHHVVGVVERRLGRVRPQGEVRGHRRPAGLVPGQPAIARALVRVDRAEGPVVQVDRRRSGAGRDLDRVHVAAGVISGVERRFRVVVGGVGIAIAAIGSLRRDHRPELARVVAEVAQRAAHRDGQRVLGRRVPGDAHPVDPEHAQEEGAGVGRDRDLEPSIRLGVHRGRHGRPARARVAVLGRLGPRDRGRGREVARHVRDAGQGGGFGRELHVDRGVPEVADIDDQRHDPDEQAQRGRVDHDHLAGGADRTAPDGPQSRDHGLGSSRITLLSVMGSVVYGGSLPENSPMSGASGVVGRKS